MAVTTRYGKEGDAVYICTDSQTTGYGAKIKSQKLFSRGGVLIAGSGNRGRIEATMDNLRDLRGKMVDPSYVSQRLVDFGRGFKFRGKQDGQSHIVVGLENGKPTIYEVVLSSQRYGMEKEVPLFRRTRRSFQGSGSSQTGPAIKRDMQTKSRVLYDPTEGLLFCFSFGSIADEDIAVDERLQIGLVTPEKTRLLYHPTVELFSEDSWEYLRTNLDLKATRDELDKLGKEDRGKHHRIYAVFNDLYQALLVSCKSMESVDADANDAHTWSKVDPSLREDYDADRREFILKRDEAKTAVTELLNSWLSGDVSVIEDSLRRYNERRMESYKGLKEAVEAIRKLSLEQ